MNSPQLIKKQQKIAHLIEKGKFREAIKPLLQICKQQPGNTSSWLKLASLYGQAGDLHSVIKVCQKIEPALKEHPMLYSLLGNAHASLGHANEAHEYHQKALGIQPNNPGLLNNLGNALYLDNKLEEAADIFLKVVAINPDYAEAHNNLGNIYKALNDNELAVKHYKYAVQLNPDLSKTYLNLGHLYADRIGQPELAEESFRKAHKKEPDNLEALSGITNMLRFQGRMDEALELIKQVQQSHRSDSGLIAAEADIYERTGKLEKAYELTKDYLHDDIKTIPPMVIDVLMRICLKHNCCDEVINVAKTMIKSSRMALPYQQNTHFRLGKLYDKLKKYDYAFNHYKAANEIIDIPFDKEKFNHRINNLIKAYNLNNIKNIQKSDIDTSLPIFIVGMPRSGTSLTEQILSSHPVVGGAGELNDLNDIASSLSETLASTQPYPACIADLSTASANSIAQSYLATIKNICIDKLRVTDKMPHNFLNLGLISLIFPQAKIIHCVRDPRDTCLSIYFQNFGWLHPYSTRLDWLAFYYKQYQRVMNHWKFEIKIPIHTVSYDDMINHQEATTRKLLDFCELEWDDACLDFHKSDRVVATASYDQVRQKIYTKSQQRWKKYEKNIDLLVENLGETLDGWPD